MTPEKQAILDAATPRPWKHHNMESATLVANHIAVADFNAKSRIDEENEANCALAMIAVNSYEAQSALIERLVKVLKGARDILAMEGYLSGPVHPRLPEIDAALDEAKKVTE